MIDIIKNVEFPLSGKGKHLWKHGKANTSEFHSWSNMKQRCYNPKNGKYHLYGARGIKVCERWLNSFENFLADMGVKPSDQHSLDRHPNNNGDYEPSNCRWATSQEQAENLRSSKLISFNGKTQSQAAWARDLRISQITLRERLEKWSIEKALTEGKDKKFKNITPEQIAKVNSESANQKALMCWCAMNYEIYPELKYFYAIPNGGRRDVITGARMKAEGVKAGVPDLFLPIKRGIYSGLYVELKKSNGVVSDDQSKWIDFLPTQGFGVIVCYSWEVARDIIIQYLEHDL